MEFGIFLGRHFLHTEEGVHHAEDEDDGAHIEAVDDAVRHHAFRGRVGNAYPGEEDGEKIAHQGTGVTKEALDAVGLRFLFLVHHFAHHHLEGLHGYIDGSIQENEGEQAEPHGHVQSQEQPGAELQGPCIGQEQHHQHGDDGAHQQIGLATAHLAPGTVRIFADQRLHDHSHQRGKDPEEGELMRIGPQRCKDAADIGALQGVGNLHPEIAEA